MMRYGAHPPPQIKDPQRYTTYNARRDNLKSSFWENAFCKHHGFVVLESFFEWVTVKDLIAAGVVKIDAVRAEFARQIEERKQKVLAAQKPFKLTPTEKQEAIFRKIIIEFNSPDAGDLLAPVIFSEKLEADGRLDRGFAIVTDEPSPEIAAAGHDRCPAFLSKPDIMRWIDPKNWGRPQELIALLGNRPKLTFNHGIPKAA
jgi:putative SOS response-associated peptidase YedK